MNICPSERVSFNERTRRGHLQNQARGSRLDSLYYYSNTLPSLSDAVDMAIVVVVFVAGHVEGRQVER
jgi:hypothetical protein